MNMEVEIISRSFIAPSSPTPPHLKIYKASLLDQFQVSVYFPTILFYQNSQETNTITKRSHLLKQSLPETLSRFYPLAGKVKDSLSIDCDDEGVCYIEAKSDITLSQYITKPDLASLNKLVPNATREYELPSGSHVALIQVTTFACGGLTIGIYLSHKAGDAISLFSFLKEWAATASNSTIKHPFLDGESIFPQYAAVPRDKVPDSVLGQFIQKGKYKTRRIVFNESAIANLKAKASSNNNNNPTRVEVVTAILSKCLMTCLQNKTGIDKPFALSHVVNIRPKSEPPIQECSMGNFAWLVGAAFTTKELSELVSQVRRAIKKVDNDFIRKLKGSEDGLLTYCDAIKEMEAVYTNPIYGGGVLDFVGFSSWCNFGIYDIDFGWGKPIWATCFVPYMDNTETVSMNLVYLTDRRMDRGVEAWVNLHDDFDLLDKDAELLQYASIDPSPII